MKALKICELLLEMELLTDDVLKSCLNLFDLKSLNHQVKVSKVDIVNEL